jgi:flagellar FliL protein
MAEEENTQENAPPKKSKKGLLIGLVLALVLGGGGFYAVFSGMVLAPSDKTESAKDKTEDLPEIKFVALEPMVVSLGADARKVLRFNAQLEVEPSRADDVSHLMPRILDVLNGYLRAVDIAELEDPAALIRLRAQMLRRIQLVTGTGHVRDLLITEFVFS